MKSPFRNAIGSAGSNSESAESFTLPCSVPLSLETIIRPNHYHESLYGTNLRQAEAAVTYNKLKAGASVNHRKWPAATSFNIFAFAFFICL